MAYLLDTIAALSSPPGAGGRGIIRLSGPRAVGIALSLCDPPPALPSTKYWAGLVKARIPGIAPRVDGALYVMRAPRSYTREDVAELHVPGSPPLLSALLEACFKAGARGANPGEFTLRAFWNGRIDLSRAEAVNKLIRARDEASRRAAVRELGGRLEKESLRLSDLLTRSLSLTEARIDFSDQDLEPAGREEILRQLEQVQKALAGIVQDTNDIREPGNPLVVLAGRANAGKSTLLNALTGRILSLVTPEPGTTRDVVTGELDRSGVTLQLADPAGLGGESGRVAEKAWSMFERWLRGADLVLLVLDRSRAPGEEEERLLGIIGKRPKFRILNKCDLPSAWGEGDIERLAGEAFRVSALTGEGMERLREALVEFFTSGEAPRSAEAFGLTARQRGAVGHAETCVKRGMEALRRGEEEIAALEIREAVESLGGLTGRDLTEEVLERIFSDFCVGK